MYVRTEAFFDALDPFGMELGLERMRALLHAMGDPQHGLRILQIAGTNGKGSAAATVTAILKAAGHKVGLYTSPHLLRLTERIQIDAREIDEASLAASVERLQRAMRSTGQRPTYFEALTAVAIDHFARACVEFAVLEVGLGGRLDATSAVAPEIEIITRIGLDHTALLGPTLTSIATEKAAILRPGSKAFIARQPPEAREAIAHQATEQRIGCFFAGRDFALTREGDVAIDATVEDMFLPRGGSSRNQNLGMDSDTPLFFETAHRGGNSNRLGPLKLVLAGDHQLDNAEVAIAAAMALSRNVDLKALQLGLINVSWPGRFQIVSSKPITIVDGAHNPDGAQVLASMCQSRFPSLGPRLVFSALEDKDVLAIAEQLFPMAKSVHLIQLDNPRALGMEALRMLAQKNRTTFECHATVEMALTRAREEALGDGPSGWVLVAGSLYLVGEVLRSKAGKEIS